MKLKIGVVLLVVVFVCMVIQDVGSSVKQSPTENGQSVLGMIRAKAVEFKEKGVSQQQKEDLLAEEDKKLMDELRTAFLRDQIDVPYFKAKINDLDRRKDGLELVWRMQAQPENLMAGE